MHAIRSTATTAAARGLRRRRRTPGSTKGSRTACRSRSREPLRELSSGRKATGCGKLDAFINEVMAQSGHKISPAAAADLIAAAQQVETALGCPVTA